NSKAIRTSATSASPAVAANAILHPSHPPTNEATGTPSTIARVIPENIIDLAQAARGSGTRLPPILAPIAQNPPMPTPSRNRANSIVAKFGAAADSASLTINSPPISSSTSRRSSHPAATASAGEAIAATAAGTVTMVAAAPWETPRLVRIGVSSATGRNSLVTSVKVPSATENTAKRCRRYTPSVIAVYPSAPSAVNRNPSRRQPASVYWGRGCVVGVLSHDASVP